MVSVDTTGPAPQVVTSASASGASFSAAAYASVNTGDDEPLALFWSKSDGDDEFAERLGRG